MSGQDREIHELRAGVSCATLLERQRPPWLLDKRESTRHCWKYRRGAGEVLIVNHDGRGWWDPHSDRKGDVFALVQFLEPGLNFGQVRRVLRELAGIAPSFPVALAPRRKETPDLPPGPRWSARRVLTRGSRTWRYLAEARALEAPVLLAASRADALREGPYGSAWFAHRDAAGAIAGIEMRGPDYRGFSADGHKTLFRLSGSPSSGSIAPITRLAVLEAPIDAMSLAGIERLRADTLYVATAGGMGPETIAALQALLRDLAVHPEAVLVAATDADAAGDRYAARLMQMAAEAGVRSGRVLPFDGRKDWNDVAKTRRHTAGLARVPGVATQEHPGSAGKEASSRRELTGRGDVGKLLTGNSDQTP